MWSSENEFQRHLLSLLENTRREIEESFKPFDFLRLFVDIKSIYNSQEEWRELKVINYRGKERSIQNLWKGIGKTQLMQKLSAKFFSEKSIQNILSLPHEDFTSINPEIQTIIVEMVNIELVDQSDFKSAR